MQDWEEELCRTAASAEITPAPVDLLRHRRRRRRRRREVLALGRCLMQPARAAAAIFSDLLHFDLQDRTLLDALRVAALRRPYRLRARRRRQPEQHRMDLRDEVGLVTLVDEAAVLPPAATP